MTSKGKDRNAGEDDEIIPLVVPDFSEPAPAPPPPPPPPEKVPPKSRRRLITGTFVATLLAVLGVIYLWHLDSANASPGPLAFSHAAAAGLDVPGRCKDCHGDGHAAMAAACNSCHDVIQAQIAAGKGLHGTLDAQAVRVCESCHLDHHGREFQMVGERSFVRSGFAGLLQYRHEKLDFRLTGAHADLACERCHRLAATKELKKGEKRFLGLSQACGSCHQDVHKGAFGNDCASCHGQDKPFKVVGGFAHSARFPLEGAHAGAACIRCHEAGTPFAVEALKAAVSAGARPPVRSCLDCHASPHREERLQAVALRLRLQPSLSCASCHPAVHKTFHGSQAGISAPLHALFGFPLEAPHAGLDCAACHAGFGKAPPPDEGPEALRSRFLARFPGRRADDCRACHRDPHQGQFETGVFQGKSCTACHEALAFKPHAFDLKKHADTAFPLAGAHAAVSCESCHKRPADRPEAARVFHGTPAACRSCHGDPHEGRFEIGAFKGKDCSACHGTEAFAPARFGAPEHELIGYSLRGAHRSTACSACHRRPEGKPEALRILAGTPRDCAACHRDVHEGQFAAGPFKGKDCAFCHSAERFTPSTFPASRHQETSFPLTGAHDATACFRCHKPPPDRPKAAAVFHGTPGRCQDCHRDAHDGLFDRPELRGPDPSVGCARCHTTERFDRIVQTRFDHDLTGWSLRGPHAALTCASCHASSADVSSARRFGKARGSTCQSCHADPHAGQFGPTATAACTQCHRPEASRFKDLAFDHNRDSRFKLDPTHAALACAACHRPAAVAPGAAAVRYKPLGVRCIDCHDPRSPALRK